MSKHSSAVKKSVTSASGATAAATPARRPPAREEIEQMAYRLWIEGGCRNDTALSDWLRAEQTLRSEENAA
jgi:hypothetical protein